MRHEGPFALVSLSLALCASLVLACSPAPPEVDLETPENAAATVGRILCAEHQDRVESTVERFEYALAIQSAKADVVADSLSVRKVNEKLDALATFYDAHEDELLECEVVLRDMSVVSKDVRVRVAIDVQTRTWDPDGSKLELEDQTTTVLMTLAKIDGDWKVVESSHDFTLPASAVGRLLD